MKRLLTRSLLAIALAVAWLPAALAATLLPNGEQVFLSDNGDPLAYGHVYFYIPSTSTAKSTWQDSTQSTLNSNPVDLDIAGRAIIYGVGAYRQVVKDAAGVTIWDQVTADTSAGAQVWGGTSGGAGNAQTLTTGSFTSTDGQVVIFRAGFSNTAAMTLTPFGSTAIPVVRDTVAGPVALTGSEVIANNIIETVYDASAGDFHLVNSQVFAGYSVSVTSSATLTNTASSNNTLTGTLTTSMPLVLPQGRLTPTTGTPIINADASGVGSVFYTQYTGNQVPVYNGTNWLNLTFSADLTLTLNSPAHTANTLYDVFAYSSAGTLAIATGPAWTVAGNYVTGAAGGGALTTGTAARGTGAGTTQLSRVNGVWVNTVALTARNGASGSIAIAANQGTYLGTVWTDATAGQTTCQVTFGANRKCGVWNAYNREPMILLAGDTTATWNYTTATLRPSNATATTMTTTITTLTGLPEEWLTVSYEQVVDQTTTTGGTDKLGIGLASTTAATGVVGQQVVRSLQGVSLIGRLALPPPLGLQAFIGLEAGSGSGVTTWNATNANQELRAIWRG